MKYGIHAYWEQKWRADYLSSIETAAKIGFDCLDDTAFEKLTMAATESVKFERFVFE